MYSNWSINIGAVYEYKYCECYSISTVLLFLNSTEDDDDDDDDNNYSSSIGANSTDDDSDDTSDGKDSADSDNGDYDSLPFDVPSQTETEEEPLMENDDLSSDLEPEDENITYGKRYANYNLWSL